MNQNPPSPFRLVIVGRPNVGKSTLFNRLYGRKRALVHNLPGVTRDRVEEKMEWEVQRRTYSFILTDTGGLGKSGFADEIATQVEYALKEADLILLVVDGHTGLVPEDREVISHLRCAGVFDRIPVFTCVNKIDHEKHETLESEFYAAGGDQTFSISAEHDRGMDELKAAILERYHEVRGEPVQAPLEEEEDEWSEEKTPSPRPERTPRIAIVGRPNVGKSTLTNAILGEDRMIVSPVAGTTVDSVDSEAMIGGEKVILIDTAGIRRKSKTEQGVEVLSVIQTKKALERADVALLMLDAEEGPTDQDEKIGSLIEDSGCGVIIGVNKWDLMKKKSGKPYTQEMAEEHLRSEMRFMRYAPILFLSAKQGKGFEDLPRLVAKILRARKARIPTKELTEWVKEITVQNNPDNAKTYLCQQTSTRPPSFICHVNDPKRIHFSLKRRMVNALRERWGFFGNPIRFEFVKSQGKKRKKK